MSAKRGRVITFPSSTIVQLFVICILSVGSLFAQDASNNNVAKPVDFPSIEVSKFDQEPKVGFPVDYFDKFAAIMIEELKNDLARMNIPFDMYLSEIKKTEEVLKEERKEIADKRVKTQLILSKISVLEDMKPDEKIVDTQVQEILKIHPDALKENVQAFVERFEMNSLVWKFLEGVK